MPAPPVKPLLDIGDALNQFAPHNVLNALLSGGQAITITPVLGRQPTLYEEMTGYGTLPKELPAEQQAGAPDPLAPIRDLLTTLLGGQLPAAPKPPEGFISPPAGTNLMSYSGPLKGKAKYEAGYMRVALAHNGDQITITAPKDRALYLEESDYEQEVEATGVLIAGAFIEANNPRTFIPPTPVLVKTNPVTLPAGKSMSFKQDKDYTLKPDRTVGSVTFRTWVNRDKYVTLIGVTPTAAEVPPVQMFKFDGKTFDLAGARKYAQYLASIGQFEKAASLYELIGDYSAASAVRAQMPSVPTGPTVPTVPTVPEAPTAAEVMTYWFRGRQFTKEEGLAEAARLAGLGQYGEAASLYEAIGENSYAAQMRKQAAAVDLAHTKALGDAARDQAETYMNAGNFTAAYAKFHEAKNYYMAADETGLANNMQERANEANSAAGAATAAQARASLEDQRAAWKTQADALMAQGRFSEAAELYKKAGQYRLAQDALDRARATESAKAQQEFQQKIQEAQKKKEAEAAAKYAERQSAAEQIRLKALEARRKAAAAKAAAAKKTKVM
jgi:tetratricopeptide (TPR) repeat protein